jgi:uncharacterized protein YjiS (DUF1127 family)
MQNSKRSSPSKADSGLLREDHILLLVMDLGMAGHAAVKRWWEYWRTRQVLAELNEQQLRDIGVTRAQALRESRRWWPGRDMSRRALAELDNSQLSNLSETGLQIRREIRRATAHHARAQ